MATHNICGSVTATDREIDILRDGVLEERHLPKGMTWGDLVARVKAELPEIWEFAVAEHRRRVPVAR